MLCKHSAFPCGEARCRWSRRCCANTVRFYAAKRGLAAEEDAVQAQDVSVRRRTLSLVERTLCKTSPFCVRKRGLAVEEDAVRTQYVFAGRSAGLRSKKRLCAVVGREDAVRTQYVSVRRSAGSRLKKMLCKHSWFNAAGI